jgi:hypothetical protein
MVHVIRAAVARSVVLGTVAEMVAAAVIAWQVVDRVEIDRLIAAVVAHRSPPMGASTPLSARPMSPWVVSFSTATTRQLMRIWSAWSLV